MGERRGREREGGGTTEGKGKAETGRDREGEGDVVLLVAFIEVLLVAFIEVLLVAFIEVLPVAFIEFHSCGWFDVNCVYRLVHVINSILICVDVNFLDFLTFPLLWIVRCSVRLTTGREGL